jgi:two-component system CheB/CheR fusion protein
MPISPNKNSFYVAGVGASAGGLEALQEFFKGVSLQSGIAYVVVQHLSPDYKSLMDELLARHTKLPIKKIESGMELMPDTIYLIPPKQNLTVFHGKLLLEENHLNRSVNLPIDIFFQVVGHRHGKSGGRHNSFGYR